MVISCVLTHSVLHFGQMPQVKDDESDPLIGTETGAGINDDGAAQTAQAWSSNKDLRA